METTTSTQFASLSGMSGFFKRSIEIINDSFQTLFRHNRSSDVANAPGDKKGAPQPKKSGSSTEPRVAKPEHQTSATLVDSSILIQKFTASSEGLKQICATTESDFLGLGNQLQSIYAESESLTQMVVALLSTEQDQTIQGALNTIQIHAANAIQELNQRREKLDKDLEGLKAIQVDLGSLSKQNNSFKQVAKNLKMVGLNISIESARTDESKNMFQALADEITQLAQTVYEVAANVSEDTASAQQNLNSIQSDISARMNHLQGLISAAEAMVKDALNEVDNLMQLTMHVMDGVGAKAKDINEQVGRLVVGIQIHDNISQRVAHIDTAVIEAVDIIKTSMGISLPPSAMEVIYGKAYGINRLQMAQLNTARDDVSSVYHQSKRALDKLLEAVVGVVQPEGFDFSSAGNVCQFDVTNSRHPVAVLKRALDQLIALFDEGLEDIRRLSAAREETSQTITRMTEHIDRVRDINFDIRLKALNAVIKSTRLGETGKAIEAIVNEMKEMAEQSNTTIQSVTDIMESIASASDDMDRNAADDAQSTDSAGYQLRNGIDEFSVACNSFKDQSFEVLDKGAALQEKIGKAGQKINFFDRLIRVFNKHQKDFTAMDGILAPFSHAVPEDWLEEEKRIIERYTMQREREAHEETLNGVRNAKNSTKGNERKEKALMAKPSEGGDSDLGDNIELF